MGRAGVFALALLLSQGAAARMYMCVDEATGKTSFTDKACETTSSVQEEIKVNPGNSGSGSAGWRRGGGKAWRSQTDTRKTGTDFNAQHRALYEDKATASTR